MLFALLAATLFTACNETDNPVNKQTFPAVINNRAIDGDQVVFSQSEANVELNYTDMLIKFTADYKDANDMSQHLTTPDMNMTIANNTVYRFNSTNGIEGYIDFTTGMMWYSFAADGSTRVVSTTHLLYAYTTSTMTNPDNGNHGEHQQSVYKFIPDARGETCTMIINNFISNLNGKIDEPEVQYSGLTVTPTATGYTISADQVESNYKGFYTLTDVHFTLSNQCRDINGSFKCNGLVHTIQGGLFSYSTIL